MKVLVVGSAGHLGAAVTRHFARSHEVTAVTRDDLDVRRHQDVRATVARVAPDAVVNCTAYTDVDAAEDDPVTTLDVNAFAVRVLAAEAGRAGAVFVHYSTDFVFDGTASAPYTESDQPNPRSTYACSKLIGEWFATEAPRHYVLRVESVFGSPPAGENARRTSVDRIVDSLMAGREVPVFVDRTVSPSYSHDVALATLALLDRGAPHGLYHCVNSGSCTWDALALEAARLLGVEARLKAVRMADAKLRAQRPMYCALSNARLLAAGVAVPSWQDALSRYVAERQKGGAPFLTGSR
jgi:dTDP-4-dehydrorhamnose reductase